ncbi:DMT family transporter [Terasakiella sp.]|uniref:DMT family transporter n=1 Tax=Terasakiella sp. TaxID=2034861 RepID=UPI003B00C110
MLSEHKGLLLGIIAVLSFSLTLPMSRLALMDIDAFTLALCRILIAIVIAGFILAVRKPPLPQKHHLLSLALCAFGIVFGFPVFTTLALQTVSASHGAVIVGLLPMCTAMAGALIGQEKPSFGFWMTGLFGTVLTFIFAFRQAEGVLAIGDVYLILAVLSAAIGYAYGGRVSKDLGSWQSTCWAIVLTAPLIVMSLFFIPLSLNDLRVGSFIGVLYVGIVSQLVGFFFYIKQWCLPGLPRHRNFS